MKSTLLQQQPRRHLLVFDRGDEVIETLTDFANENGIRSGSFQAIGALSAVTFAYWNPETKQYEKFEVNEQVEVVALTGNIATGTGGEPKVHAHIAIGRRDGELRGGHLLSGRVLPTLELFLVDYGGKLERQRDPETELPLLRL